MSGAHTFVTGSADSCCATAVRLEPGSCCATAALRERGDILAHLARQRANCALVENHSADFRAEAAALGRMLDRMIEEIGGGRHEGADVARALRPSPSTGLYPFADHRTQEAVLAAAETAPETTADTETA